MDLDFDRKHLWHPYTSMNQPLKTYPVVSAKENYLFLEDGQKLIDGMSSWWAAIHGYQHPHLDQAIENQLKSMSHVMYGGISHEPAIRLGKKLLEILPSHLKHIFYADSGSVSVEVALKMAIQYQHSKGKGHKTQFMTFLKGYHGDTSGAMSVCDPQGGMHHMYSKFLPQHYFCPAPTHAYHEKPRPEELNYLDDFFENHASDSAAFILEPTVQGAGGMNIYHPDYLIKVAELCKKHEILLIADEIATGFGRTGKMFGCDHAPEIQADIMCLGKALSGGYMTFAATVCTSDVAQTISNGEAGVMMHGPTFMANPLACAVALASLEIICNEKPLEHIQKIAATLNENLSPLTHHPKVKRVSVLGAIGVVQCKNNIHVQNIQSYFVEKGLWIRPFRDLIYIMPPFITPLEDVKQLCKGIKGSLDLPEHFVL